MTDTKLWQVVMRLKPVPREVYLERGQAENEMAARLMSEGVIRQFFVTTDHKQYWMLFAAESEQALTTILSKFPFYEFFDYTAHEVMDMVAAVAGGMTDPNLEGS